MKLRPVKPFEPIMTNILPTGERLIAQIKWDGVRMLVYHDSEGTELINRKGNNRTRQYPELMDTAAYCRADSFILDGEIIALVDGVPSFHQVMKRDSLRQEQQIRARVQQVPIVYMVFDILYLNGESVTNKPLHERQALLAQVLIPSPLVQAVPSYPDIPLLHEISKQHQLEGIVIKDLDSVYAVGGKDKRWQKRKNILDLNAVVGGVTYRDGLVNALLLGLYDVEGKLIYIGHAGTGKLAVADWRRITEEAATMLLKDRPFANQSERQKGAVWIRPEWVVKVNFLEWTPGGTLRQPSIQAFVDTAPEDCKLDQ
ncbi:RNA ligase family protein [Paenibacillus dokdonensis]|uniref:DNA ligase (ATP) n=1 Tax=Paenibacillus dokdonensis TaxID=2567944 RepID=A0ABU6GMA8_9BACL|nr:DNA ligase [Paenibacillus dokdonensis]MEC0239287.1 RNA ligase family protein [Paenibacillus dokdonensis]